MGRVLQAALRAWRPFNPQHLKSRRTRENSDPRCGKWNLAPIRRARTGSQCRRSHRHIAGKPCNRSLDLLAFLIPGHLLSRGWSGASLSTELCTAEGISLSRTGPTIWDLRYHWVKPIHQGAHGVASHAYSVDGFGPCPGGLRWQAQYFRLAHSSIAVGF